MPKKYDSCVSKVKKKIKLGITPKTFRCDSTGKPDKKGKRRCKSNPHKLCSKTRWQEKNSFVQDMFGLKRRKERNLIRKKKEY